jgi:hypothetical protein
MFDSKGLFNMSNEMGRGIFQDKKDAIDASKKAAPFGYKESDAATWRALVDSNRDYRMREVRRFSDELGDPQNPMKGTLAFLRKWKGKGA